jgi:M61 glycyl aminopeptidase
MTTRAIRRAAQAAFCAAILAAFSLASDVSYTVSLDAPERHLVQVQIILPAGTAQRELQLPVWNALYQVRDFAQFVNWVRAKDRAGNILPIQQANDSHWQLEGAPEGAIVEYQIYVDSFGPFGSQLNSHHAAADDSFQPGAQRLAYRHAPAECVWPLQRRIL